jgi:hypothetical protein
MVVLWSKAQRKRSAISESEERRKDGEVPYLTNY